jgi:hypothetical protein
VRAFAGFLVRLVGYALALGITARIASALWVQFGLDNVIDLQPFHDRGFEVLLVAPLPLALLGFGVLRRPALFVAAVLIGAALTAPFAAARFSSQTTAGDLSRPSTVSVRSIEPRVASAS